MDLHESSAMARVVLVTCATEAEALAIARAVVSEQLAACVNVVPGITSVYRWEGQLVEDPEWLLVIKTLAHQLPPLAERVRALHRYTVPEFVALPAAAVAAPYFDWLMESVP